jgi:hypothetical protein
MFQNYYTNEVLSSLTKPLQCVNLTLSTSRSDKSKGHSKAKFLKVQGHPWNTFMWLAILLGLLLFHNPPVWGLVGVGLVNVDQNCTAVKAVTAKRLPKFAVYHRSKLVRGTLASVSDRNENTLSIIGNKQLTSQLYSQNVSLLQVSSQLKLTPMPCFGSYYSKSFM